MDTPYTVELMPDQARTLARFAEYDGNSPEDELVRLFVNGIGIRIERMRKERLGHVLRADCPVCGVHRFEPCRDWRPGEKAGGTVPVARPWRDDVHPERVRCVIAPGRGHWSQRDEDFMVSVGGAEPIGRGADAWPRGPAWQGVREDPEPDLPPV